MWNYVQRDSSRKIGTISAIFVCCMVNVCTEFPQFRRTIRLIFPYSPYLLSFCILKARKLHFFHHFRPLSCAKKFDPGYKFDVGKWESMKKCDYQHRTIFIFLYVGEFHSHFMFIMPFYYTASMHLVIKKNPAVQVKVRNNLTSSTDLQMVNSCGKLKNLSN